MAKVSTYIPGARDIINMKIQSSCEIESFVETRLCKLCVILRSRVLPIVCPNQGYRSARHIIKNENTLQL